MRNSISVCLFILFGFQYGFSQVKIGENPQQIDASSILELESSNKALVLTRITDAEMNSFTPLNGALVYNTDAKCIFVFEGSIWKSLCNSEITVTSSATAPTSNQVGDVWIDTTDNKVGIWNGVNWVTINTNPKSGDGVPSPTTVDNPLAGDIYVNRINGNIYTYTGSSWIDNSAGSQVGNGLSKSLSDVVELGGVLTRPTVIEANTTNTLALEGLEVVDDNSNMVVTIDATTNVLKRTPISALLQKEEIVIVANNGQNQFSTPLAITNTQKIDVYRNGVKIDFIAIGSNTIELETNVICYQNDEIRIVQFF